MKKVVIILVIFAIFMLSADKSGARKIQEMKKRSGSALYSNYRGTATITEVKKTAKSKAQVQIANRYEGYEIWFLFEPEEGVEIEENWGRRFAAKKHLFKLANGLYPSKKYIEKYNIKPDKAYGCTLRVMRQGTGTQFIFVFDELPKDDFPN